MAQKFQFEELDHETQEYLLIVRDLQGKGLPGIFVPASNYLPVFGFIFGFMIIIATVLLTFPPTHQPHVEAMLQTAGFLLGGWMIVAAIRVWAARKSGKYIGHFTYADAETLYEARGSAVAITDLNDLREARAVQHFNDKGYQNTEITLKIQRDSYTFKVEDEERGRRLNAFLNSVAFMRDGGEDGNDDALRKLSPEVMGSVAKEVARTGQFPRDLVADDLEVARVPRPKKENRASTGVLAIAITFLVAVGMFSVFTSINEPFRDTAVFNRIQELQPKDRPPAIRLYLANEKFNAHRDAAQQLLDGYYDSAAQKIQGTDPAVKQPFAEVFLGLKTKPAPVLSLQIVELDGIANAIDATARISTLRTALADKWGSTLGDELVVFATPEDKDIKGNIDIRYKIIELNAVEYTITFRHGPDDEKPLATFTETVRDPNPATLMMNLQLQILNKSIGTVLARPPAPLNLDF